MSTSRRSPKADLGECPCSGATLARLIQPAIMSLLACGAPADIRNNWPTAMPWTSGESRKSIRPIDWLYSPR